MLKPFIILIGMGLLPFASIANDSATPHEQLHRQLVNHKRATLEAQRARPLQQMAELSASDRTSINAVLSDLSPEERAMFREEALDRWDQLTPNQRARIRQQLKEKWEALPPAKRRAIIKQSQPLREGQ